MQFNEVNKRSSYPNSELPQCWYTQQLSQSSLFSAEFWHDDMIHSLRTTTIGNMPLEMRLTGVYSVEKSLTHSSAFLSSTKDWRKYRNFAWCNYFLPFMSWINKPVILNIQEISFMLEMNDYYISCFIVLWTRTKKCRAFYKMRGWIRKWQDGISFQYGLARPLQIAVCCLPFFWLELNVNPFQALT